MKKIVALSLITLAFSSARLVSQTNYESMTGKCPYGHTIDTAKALVIPSIIDDFEFAEATYKRWSNPMESGKMRSSIELSDTAHAGKKGGKISFTGVKSAGSWTNLQCKTTIPTDKTKITFWARAEKECKVNITIYQGADHKDMEIFGKQIVIGTEWKKYEVNINEISDIIFSHPKQDGGTASAHLTKANVFAIGFSETESAATFFLDNLTLE